MLHDKLTREIREGPSGPKIAAFFDVDRTLLAGFSAVSFMRERITSGRAGLGELAHGTARHDLVRAGPHRLLGLRLRAHAGISRHPRDLARRAGPGGVRQAPRHADLPGVARARARAPRARPHDRDRVVGDALSGGSRSRASSASSTCCARGSRHRRRAHGQGDPPDLLRAREAARGGRSRRGVRPRPRRELLLQRQRRRPAAARERRPSAAHQSRPPPRADREGAALARAALLEPRPARPRADRAHRARLRQRAAFRARGPGGGGAQPLASRSREHDGLALGRPLHRALGHRSARRGRGAPVVAPAGRVHLQPPERARHAAHAQDDPARRHGRGQAGARAQPAVRAAVPAAGVVFIDRGDSKKAIEALAPRSRRSSRASR